MRNRIPTLLVAALPTAPAAGYETLRYADEDGTIETGQVELVRKDTETDFSVRVRMGGRLRTLNIPARRVLSFRRGDSTEINQWSKLLAKGKRLMAAGQLATRGTTPGAEELFTNIAYSTERGVRGQEKTEAISPWHNMYAVYYLIECRYKMGLAGDASRLAAALDNVAEFKKRSASKASTRRKLKWQVPAHKGTTEERGIYTWGGSRLRGMVELYEARIQKAMKNTDAAKASYETLITRARKAQLSPLLLTAAILEKAELEAEGQPSRTQEETYRAAGNSLAILARNQPDAFGRAELAKSANRALLKGADLLLASAVAKDVTWELPLARYMALRDSEGRRDPALYMGAQAGVGICLTEKGEGEKAYRALLEVVVKGYEYPQQMARALYYLGRAAPQFAKEVDSTGGKGDFLRAEAPRWWADLKERYPSSPWARKAQGNPAEVGG